MYEIKPPRSSVSTYTYVCDLRLLDCLLLFLLLLLSTIFCLFLFLDFFPCPSLVMSLVDVFSLSSRVNVSILFAAVWTDSSPTGWRVETLWSALSTQDLPEIIACSNQVNAIKLLIQIADKNTLMWRLSVCFALSYKSAHKTVRVCIR